ncbi:histidine--tRNA ligase [Caproiciproducens galactitolivorans]|uniref:Histidine--tRNA ligase n=1 Tax=Caproiciproducens galactitolivorans TaxID=642589 RepID=A0A4Z0YDN5_9FIRM|nr:histidine--tRNA ligase [Caproiciproducens galactitolivorans]QEY35312.1 histidine--tRNA ligase [Caproiciproducens galactitolivorans]TGJ77010.1 histidine--tRNA ligase [Caproiciproducens galactitolivorans]
MELIKAQKGTQDLLPIQTGKWQVVEDVMRSEAKIHGFGEIRTPVFEDTRLFQRSVGETTDVVQKEMYTFNDKGGRSITLRPEGTAGVVRALLEHGLYNEGLPQKLYYFTSCYRYENTQAGRLREFHQFGMEMLGAPSPMADAELISIAKSIFDRLGVRSLRLEINSIGCPDCRAKYYEALKAYFSGYKDQLCETCLGRLERNPMRILDCKSPICSKIAAGAPRMLDYLCDECKEHFESVKSYLDAVKIEYNVNPAIVRGLDYYTKTVFEFVSGDLGAQSTVCGGGRYDGLVEEMGGQHLPALGFGLGMERLIMIMEKQNIEMPEPETCDIFIAALGEAAKVEAFRLAHSLQEYSIIAACDLNDRGLKAQMKYADKIGAKYTLVLGDNELESKKAMVKNMKTGEKEEVDLSKDFVEQFIVLQAKGEDDIAF